jgi:hypothetical protein
VTLPQPTQLTRDTALRTLALDLIVRVVRYEAEEGIEWENYPELREADFEAVLALAKTTAEQHAPTPEDRVAAEAFLAAQPAEPEPPETVA